MKKYLAWHPESYTVQVYCILFKCDPTNGPFQMYRGWGSHLFYHLYLQQFCMYILYWPSWLWGWCDEVAVTLLGYSIGWGLRGYDCPLHTFFLVFSGVFLSFSLPMEIVISSASWKSCPRLCLFFFSCLLELLVWWNLWVLYNSIHYKHWIQRPQPPLSYISFYTISRYFSKPNRLETAQVQSWAFLCNRLSKLSRKNMIFYRKNSNLNSASP